MQIIGRTTNTIALVAEIEDGSWWLLEKLPQQQITPSLCLLAVKIDGLALQYVPEQLKTPALCQEAVLQTEWALQYVPAQMITQNMCDDAVRKNAYTLQFTPKIMRKKWMCMAGLKKSGMMLRCVPNTVKTPAMCIEAVKRSPTALRYVPKAMKTVEMCAEAVRENGLALRFVPKAIKTPTMCVDAVIQNRLAMNYVPSPPETIESDLAAMALLNTFTRRLKWLMASAGLHQAAFAREIDTTSTCVSGWVTGKTKAITDANIFKITNYFSVLEPWLIAGEGPMRIDAINNGVCKESGLVYSLPRTTAPIVFTEESGHVCIKQDIFYDDKTAASTIFIHPDQVDDLLTLLKQSKKEALRLKNIFGRQARPVN